MKYHGMRVATPRRNVKVEHQYRTDEKRFYKKKCTILRTVSAACKIQQKTNTIPKIRLRFFTPNEILAKYLSVM